MAPRVAERHVVVFGEVSKGWLLRTEKVFYDEMVAGGLEECSCEKLINTVRQIA